MTMQNEPNYSFSQKWPNTISKQGFTQIPNALLEGQAKLKITNPELAVIIQCLKYKWSSKNPYPSVDGIARTMGQHPDTTRRLFRTLERKGLIRRVFRTGDKNEYDFSPLVKKLELIPASKQSPAPSANLSMGVSKNADTPPATMQTKEDAAKKTTKKTHTNEQFQHISLGLKERYGKLINAVN